MINQDKKALRVKFSAVRDSIADIVAHSDKIYYFLTHSSLYRDADTVLLYWSMGSEVITQPMIDKVLFDGKKLALPKCIDSNGNMLFYYISSADDLCEGFYGIKEPTTNNLADDFTDNTLCLVPGLSFSKDGYRLGYGKGYYDRFLDGFQGVCVGLCYEECLTEYLPTDEYDKKVNYIITNKTIYVIK